MAARRNTDTAKLGLAILTLTRGKLEEAQFFLSHVERTKGKHPDFDHFLNAFIGAAHSVTFVMQAEYGHVAGLKTGISPRILVLTVCYQP